MPKSSNLVLVILAFFSIYVIWGSTYLLNKIAVNELPPFMLASIRFTTAGLLIFVIARAMGISLAISKKQFINTIIAGFLFLTFGNGIVVWALKYVDSGFAALEISAQPLVVLLLMRIFQGKKIKPMSVVGVVFGVVGIYLLVSQKELVNQENSIIGMIMIFLCMISWGYGSLFVGKADLPKNYFVNTGYQMLTGGMMLMLSSLIFGETWTMPTVWSQPVQISMLLLIVFGSIVAFTSFNYLLKVVSPEKVATSTYVNPIIALLLGWYFLNEQITTQSIVAAVVLLTGVYFINTTKTFVIFSRFTGKQIISKKPEAEKNDANN
ncbi:drug/metabolite transporter (DMT)-like permease [Ulvibacter sp. MAR_2010_11]|uniref:EamA family transporter n=1 Tax=Ulvibacter sp. MAR_2010_11 TaxID=1250229 RepID=UPI000C2BA536|nr:EamA family transporter [Ulvibacter sp. MAR_2010_11]PKA84151.1 drug/metabolite transporter (DMT)-like permease [Ulvibacter sp. MAR_2010_11]